MIVDIVLVVLIFAVFPSLFAVGWKLAKIQKSFINFLTTAYPDTWRTVMRKNPYEELNLAPGFTSLSFYLTNRDLDDNEIRRRIGVLKKFELMYFSLFGLGATLLLFLLFH